MKSTVKAIVTVALAGVLALGAFAGCSKTSADEVTKSTTAAQSAKTDSNADSNTEQLTLKIGANLTPHAEILEKAAPILEKEGVKLEIVKLEDSVTPNVGVADGSLDANYFQHQPYLDQYNEENKTNIVSAGAIHYEPFGIYAGKTKAIADIAEGAIVAVPNNVTNEARALLLLQQEGLLKLADGAGINATVNDITDNPKKLEIKEIAPEQLVRALPDVDIAIINGNYAIEGGLKVADALAVEANDGLAAETYGNIIAVDAKNKDNPAVAKLVEVLQGKEIADYINQTYGGAVVPLNK